MGETRVYEVYDAETGQTFGVCPTRYQARKLAGEMGGLVRRVWVSKIVTNKPERYARCATR